MLEILPQINIIELLGLVPFCFGIVEMIAGQVIQKGCQEAPDYSAYSQSVEGAVELAEGMHAQISSQLAEDITGVEQDTVTEQSWALGNWRDQIKDFSKQTEEVYAKAGVAESGAIEKQLEEQLSRGRRQKKQELTQLKMKGEDEIGTLEQVAGKEMRMLQRDIAKILSEYSATTGANLGEYEGPDHGFLYDFFN